MKKLIPAFTAGELSPSLHARVDIEKYHTGLKTAKNMIVHPHGGISNRGGTYFVAETKDSTKKSRLIPFEFSDEQKYAIEFGDGYCRFYKDRALLELDLDYPNSKAYNPGLGYLSSDVSFMSSYQRVYFGFLGGNLAYLYICCGRNATYGDSVTTLVTTVNTGDTLDVTYTAGSKTLTIKFATTTKLLNSAEKIQAKIRELVDDHADFANFVVIENVPLTLDRPHSGFTGVVQSVYVVNVAYVANTTISQSPTNTADAYPLGESSDWDVAPVDTQDEIVSPYTEDDLEDLKIIQSADVLYIAHPSYAPRKLSRYAINNFAFESYEYHSGPFMLSNPDDDKTITADVLTKGAETNLVATTSIFDASSPSEHIGSLWEMRHYIEGQRVTQTYTGFETSGSIKCGGTWRIITHGTWNGALTLQKSIDGGTTWTEVRTFSSLNDYNANTYGDIGEQCLIRVERTAFTSGTADITLSSDPFSQKGIVKITSVTDNSNAKGIVVDEIGSTDPTDDWAEGSWSDFRGWPSCVVFYQDRLCWASTDSEPQSIWMSKTGIYNDFGRSEPLLDIDGISVRIPSRKINRVKNLVVLSGITAYTSSSEWLIKTGSSGILTPTSIVITKQGERGSSNVEPIVVGNRGIFLQSLGKVLRDFAYDYSSDSLDGISLTILSSHLLKNNPVVDFTFQQEPDSLVWCVMEDGAMLSMTYLKEQEVMAWTRHDTDGKFESICSLPGEGSDEIWMIVKRGSSRFIEVMGARQPSIDVKDQFFVDSGVTLDSPITITGATQADPVVITAVDHGLSDDDLVDIVDIEGMIELNGNRYKIIKLTDDTFELTNRTTSEDIDGTGFTAYTEGGEARLAVTTVGGLSHLEGEEVSVLADGFELTKTVASGEITLTSEASRVHVGLGYVSDFETLDVELNLQSGTVQGSLIKVSEVIIRFLESRGGFLGADFDNMDPINNERTTEDIADPILLKTGDVSQLMGQSGFSDGGRICYRQTLPLPVTILGVIPELTVGS